MFARTYIYIYNYIHTDYAVIAHPSEATQKKACQESTRTKLGTPKLQVLFHRRIAVIT